MSALRGFGVSGLAKTIAVGALAVGLLVQAGPAVAGTIGGGPNVYISFSASPGVVDVLGTAPITHTTVMATKGTVITGVATNDSGFTLVDCRLTLSSSQRGGVFYDRTVKAPKASWCSSPMFKVRGAPGDFEDVVVQVTVDYTDPSNANLPGTVSVNDVLQIATTAY